MKKTLYFLFLSIILFCGCISGTYSPPPIELVFPDKELMEIIVRGWYYPEDPERVEAIEKDSRNKGFLREGESFEEKYPEALDEGDERFQSTGRRYCYNETDDKEPVFKHNFKIRLYDKEDNLLTEDFLRLAYPDNDDDSPRIIAYLPYHKEGHELRIVRLQGRREVILKKSGVMSKSELISRSYPDTDFYHGERVYVFNEEIQCHIGPGPM